MKLVGTVAASMGIGKSDDQLRWTMTLMFLSLQITSAISLRRAPGAFILVTFLGRVEVKSVSIQRSVVILMLILTLQTSKTFHAAQVHLSARYPNVVEILFKKRVLSIVPSLCDTVAPHTTTLASLATLALCSMSISWTALASIGALPTMTLATCALRMKTTATHTTRTA